MLFRGSQFLMDASLVLSSNTDLLRIRDIKQLHQLIANVLNNLKGVIGFTSSTINENALLLSNRIYSQKYKRETTEIIKKYSN